MSLTTQISSVVSAIGASIKSVLSRVTALENKSNVVALTSSAGVVTADLSVADYFELLNLAENVTTLTLTNLPASGKGGIFGMLISQDGTGGRTFALPASFHPLGNSDTAIQSAANAKTAFIFWTLDQGATFLYSMAKVV